MHCVSEHARQPNEPLAVVHPADLATLYESESYCNVLRALFFVRRFEQQLYCTYRSAPEEFARCIRLKISSFGEALRWYASSPSHGCNARASPQEADACMVAFVEEVLCVWTLDQTRP